MHHHPAVPPETRQGSVRHTVAAALGALGLLLATVLLTAPPVQAHATLIASSPQDGATLTERPADVTLQFSGELQPEAQVIVTGPDGESLAAGATRVSGDTLIQRISDQGGAAGAYSVRYFATSVDGHELAGRVLFDVGGDGAASAGEAEPSEAAPADDEGSGVPWLTVVLAVVAAAAVTALVVTRRRTPAQPVAPSRPRPPGARPVGREARELAGRSQQPRPRPRK